jgi:predicted O-methyltransferase YrrM
MKKWITLFLISFLPILNATDSEWEKLKQKTLFLQKILPGWCVPEKATKMMNLIYDTKPDIIVEIGVFGGSSVYPMAEALRFQKKGVIYAIDPWEKVDCQVGFSSNDPNYVWWTKLDLENIYQGFIKMIDQNHLTNYCNTIRSTSQNAVDLFEDDSIDILHVDGNHSEISSLLDVTLYLPKVKKGGYIWFDDVNWKTTNSAVKFLQENCIFDEMRSIGDKCYLFQKQK